MKVLNKFNHIILTICLFLLLATSVSGQTSDFIRAMGAYQSDDLENAEALFKKELGQNPDNLNVSMYRFAGHKPHQAQHPPYQSCACAYRQAFPSFIPSRPHRQTTSYCQALLSFSTTLRLTRMAVPWLIPSGISICEVTSSQVSPWSWLRNAPYWCW